MQIDLDVLLEEVVVCNVGVVDGCYYTNTVNLLSLLGCYYTTLDLNESQLDSFNLNYARAEL